MGLHCAAFAALFAPDVDGQDIVPAFDERHKDGIDAFAGEGTSAEMGREELGNIRAEAKRDSGCVDDLGEFQQVVCFGQQEFVRGEPGAASVFDDYCRFRPCGQDGVLEVKVRCNEVFQDGAGGREWRVDFHQSGRCVQPGRGCDEPEEVFGKLFCPSLTVPEARDAVACALRKRGQAAMQW